ADVAEAVELRADLAELAAHELVVIDHLVRAERAERLRNLQAEVARAEDRHAALVCAAELVHVSLRDHALCLEHLRGRDSVRGAALIRRAPARRETAVALAEREPGRRNAENDDERDDHESSAHRFPPRKNDNAAPHAAAFEPHAPAPSTAYSKPLECRFRRIRNRGGPPWTRHADSGCS